MLSRPVGLLTGNRPQEAATKPSCSRRVLTASPTAALSSPTVRWSSPVSRCCIRKSALKTRHGRRPTQKLQAKDDRDSTNPSATPSEDSQQGQRQSGQTPFTGPGVETDRGEAAGSEDADSNSAIRGLVTALTDTGSKALQLFEALSSSSPLDDDALTAEQRSGNGSSGAASSPDGARAAKQGRDSSSGSEGDDVDNTEDSSIAGGSLKLPPVLATLLADTRKAFSSNGFSANGSRESSSFPGQSSSGDADEGSSEANPSSAPRDDAGGDSESWLDSARSTAARVASLGRVPEPRREPQEVIIIAAPPPDPRPWWEWRPWGRLDPDYVAPGSRGPSPPSYVPVDFSSAAAMEATPFAAEPVVRQRGKFVLPADIGTFWGLLVLGVAYVHHSTTGFSVPALLPLINEDLHLTDSQGALLTAGYTVLYALALIPVGLLADRVDRPRLLAGGIVLWSLLTMAASRVHGFGELLTLRIGFAIAQATQNPVCFSLIPELFPRERTTAMAAYNAAIYMGRALSFGAVILAGQLGIPTGDIGVTMVPLDNVDLSSMSLLYTQGEMAAVTPVYEYDFSVLYGATRESSWREILYWVGPPGIVIGLLVLLTLDEPRALPGKGFLVPPLESSRFLKASGVKSPKVVAAAAPAAAPAASTSLASLVVTRGRPVSAAAIRGESPRRLVPAAVEATTWELVKELIAKPSFQAVTFACALNDVGSWSLIAWQATFYQRVYELGPETYAPLLAVIIPIGGILGGVGGGLCGDWLSRIGGRQWLTAGASIAAAPIIAVSLLASEYQQSFAALLVGFALSEAWRAPAAIMIRDVSPQQLGSTASAIHLCFRNLIGGLGPLGVAWLSSRVGLQYAMLIVPTCYAASGFAFLNAERIMETDASSAAAAMKRNSSRKELGHPVTASVTDI